MCPHCGALVDSHTDPMSGARPVAGDATMCWGCGRWAVFAAPLPDVELRRPTLAELAELHRHPDAVAIKTAWRRKQGGS